MKPGHGKWKRLDDCDPLDIVFHNSAWFGTGLSAVGISTFVLALESAGISALFKTVIITWMIMGLCILWQYSLYVWAALRLVRPNRKDTLYPRNWMLDSIGVVLVIVMLGVHTVAICISIHVFS